MPNPINSPAPGTGARNGTSAVAASAATTNPAGTAAVTGAPDPFAKLVDALAPTVESQLAARSNAPSQPAETAGRTRTDAPARDETSDATQLSAPANEPAAEETPAAGEGPTETPVEEAPTEGAENTEGPADGTETPVEGAEATEPAADEEPLPAGLQKRIGKLLGKLEEQTAKIEALEARLATPATTAEAGTGGAQFAAPEVARVTDAAQLDAMQTRAQAGLQEVDRLLARLPVAPRKVEQFFRDHGIGLKNAEGEEEFSPEGMGEALIEARERFQQQLYHIPQRRTYLQQYEAAHKQVLAVAPWVGDKTDPRRAQLDTIAAQFPNVRALPNWEFWVACAIEGEKVLKAKAPNGGKPRAAAPRNGAAAVNSPAGVRRVTASPGGAPSAGTRPGTGAAKIGAVRQKVLKEGTKQSLAEAFEAIGVP